MNKFFDIKRTKMIDEAALGHKPRQWPMALLVFILVFLIASAIQGVIFEIPFTIYSTIKLTTSDVFMSAVESGVAYNELIDIAIEYMTDIIDSMDVWYNLISLFTTGVIIATAIVYCLVIEKRKIATMGIRKKDAVPEYAIGLLIGGGMFAISVLLSLAFGASKASVNSNISIGYIILFFLAFVVQGASEEFLLRGYFMVSLSRDYAPSIAIAVSSVVFSILHIGNDGFGIIALINIFLFGAFLGIYVFKRGDLWGACAIHTAWNFAQGNIFGVSVSGMKILPSIFRTELDTGKSVLNGGAFGLEGGLCVTMVLVVAIVIALSIKTKASAVSDTERTSANE